MRTRYITPAHLVMVRCLERGKGEFVSLDAICDCACITRGTAIAYVSYLRTEFGYTAIEGTPATGYRIGEWPGREVPRDGRSQRGPKRKEFDSSEGVVVTPAGRELGL